MVFRSKFMSAHKSIAELIDINPDGNIVEPDAGKVPSGHRITQKTPLPRETPTQQKQSASQKSGIE